MNKLILHRGNTKIYGENRRETIETKTVYDDKYILDYLSKSKSNSTVKQEIEIILEVDVILTPPFLISHDTLKLGSEIFEFDNNHNDNNDNNNDKLNTPIYKIDNDTINMIVYKDTKTKPLILKELMEMVKNKNIILYLDIKVPTYERTYSNEKVLNNLIKEDCEHYDNINTIKENVSLMLDIIEKYSSNIDSIFSFTNDAIKTIKSEIIKRGIKNVKIGMFYYKVYNSQLLNIIYHWILKYYLDPDVISYDCMTIEENRLCIFNDKKKYMWTLHKSVLSDKYEFIKKYDISPIIDMFDK